MSAELPNADDPVLAGLNRLARLRYLLGDENVPERMACYVLEHAPRRNPPTFAQMWATVQRRSAPKGTNPRGDEHADAVLRIFQREGFDRA